MQTLEHVAIARSNELCNCKHASSTYICSFQLFHSFGIFSASALAPFSDGSRCIVPSLLPSSSQSSASALAKKWTCFLQSLKSMCSTAQRLPIDFHCTTLCLIHDTDAKNEPVLRLFLGLPACILVLLGFFNSAKSGRLLLNPIVSINLDFFEAIVTGRALKVISSRQCALGRPLPCQTSRPFS